MSLFGKRQARAEDDALLALARPGARARRTRGAGAQRRRRRRLRLQGAGGCELTTVEGLADEAGLHPRQEAFKAHHALQCGSCTPGFLMTALALLRDHADPSETEVREYLSGNICRCTGYQFIVDAVLDVARRRQSNVKT